MRRADKTKRRDARGWVDSTCLLRGFAKGVAPHLAHDLAEQSVVCYTLCRRCPENTVAAGDVFCQQEFLKIRRKIPCFQKRNSLLSEGHYWLFKVSLRGLMALP